MTDDGARANFAYVLPPGSERPPLIRPPLTGDAVEHDRVLREFVATRAVAFVEEDLDRGDDYPEVTSGEQSSAVRMIARSAHERPEDAFAEATTLMAELQSRGYTVSTRSRVGAAVATGPDQHPAGWWALLDLDLLHPGVPLPVDVHER